MDNTIIESASEKNKLGGLLKHPLLSKDLLDKYNKALTKRNKYKNKIISITGTCGKTTLSNLLKNALSTTYVVEKTWNNSNSIRGIPWCINNDLNLNSDFWIIEVGISKKNEMKLLLDLVQPDIRIITNVGIAHSDNFENEKEYQKEKLVYLKNLSQNTVVIINNDDPILHTYNYPKNIHVIRCGSNLDSDVILQKYTFNHLTLTSNISIKTKKGVISFTTTVIGKHLSKLMCLVTACCLYLNVPLEKLPHIFQNFKYCENRGNIIKKNKITIFNYSYNANPTSFEANLLLFKEIKHKNKIIIIGDMLKINKQNEYFHHKEIYKKCLQITKNICIFTEVFKQIVVNEDLPYLFMENNIDSLGVQVSNYIKLSKNCAIFIQGSNNTNINKILKYL